MAELTQKLWDGIENEALEHVRRTIVRATDDLMTGGSSKAVCVSARQEIDFIETSTFETVGRPASRAMEAIDTGRVAAVERPLPGLGPNRQEQQAERSRAANEAQERLFPRERPQPIATTPEEMRSARNAELFPRGTDNDNDR
jgi:hypothetical protein